jgi:hypothetical protein
VDEHWIDELECLIDSLTDLGASQDKLPRNEDEQDNFRFHHAIREAGFPRRRAYLEEHRIHIVTALFKVSLASTMGYDSPGGGYEWEV